MTGSSNGTLKRTGKAILSDPEIRIKLVKELYKKKKWRFKEIHQLLLDMGIIWNKENRKTTSRIVKRLLQLGILEKQGRWYIVKQEVSAFSPSLYAYELEKQGRNVYRLNIEDTHVMLANFDPEEMVIHKFNEEDMKEIRMLVDIVYHIIKAPIPIVLDRLKEVLIQIWGKSTDDIRKKELKTLLGFLVAAYEYLEAHFGFGGRGAVVLTPRPEAISKLEAIRAVIAQSKGPYQMAYELAEIVDKKNMYMLDLVLNTEISIKKLGEKGVKLVKTLLPIFKLYHNIKYIPGKLRMDYSRKEEVAEQLINLAKEHGLKQLGIALGLLGSKGCQWTKRLLKEYNFVEVPEERFRELEEGFREGKKIYNEFVKEIGMNPREYETYLHLGEDNSLSLDELESYVKSELLFSKGARASPLEVLIHSIKSPSFIKHCVCYYDILEDVATRVGFSKQWISEFIKYSRYVCAASYLIYNVTLLYLLGDMLEEDEYELCVRSEKELKQKYTWEDVVRGLAIADLRDFPIDRDEDTIAKFVINNILPKVFSEIPKDKAWKLYIEMKEEVRKADKRALKKYSAYLKASLKEALHR